MHVRRGYSFRLMPDALQAAQLRRRIGTCRAVYNVALVQRAQFWRAFKRIEDAHISFASQCEELTALRAEFDWIEARPITPQQQALRDLQSAYKNFFTGKAQ